MTGSFQGLLIYRWMQHRQDIVVASAYVYNHYQGGKEANYFLSTDRINAVTVLPPNKVILAPFIHLQLLTYIKSYIFN